MEQMDEEDLIAILINRMSGANDGLDEEHVRQIATWLIQSSMVTQATLFAVKPKKKRATR